jgi:predicted metalloprotease with PDZ domain
MKKTSRHYLACLFLVIFAVRAYAQFPQAPIVYEVDLSRAADDLFHVTVYPPHLSGENSVFNFVGTAPGTYEILDFGRFVKSFRAYDTDGNELNSERLSTNRWNIQAIGRLKKIHYDIEDSWDAEGGETIAPMSGTGIQDDFVVFNTFGVLGFFSGLQTAPAKLKIIYRKDWDIGTALEMDSAGYYSAENYDGLADSPILMGTLSSAKIKINDIDVGVFVFYPPDQQVATKLLSSVTDVLLSAGRFIERSPVRRYKYLITLLDFDTFEKYRLSAQGALEHSSSSLYVLAGGENNLEGIEKDMAHEFLHILTPLNLHSDAISPYNFVTPTPSRHLWLYEGVTEWASSMMLYRNHVMSLEELLHTYSQKLSMSEEYEPTMSLVQLSMGVYERRIRSQYTNFYMRGALTAALLDIRLLDLSKGKKGLREVLLGLLQEYGKDKPFPENGFFRILVNSTYPEINQFINDYIKDAKPLPYKEYFSKLGIEYIPERPSQSPKPTLGFAIARVGDNELYAAKISKEAHQYGLQKGDRIVRLFNVGAGDPDFTKKIEALRDSMKVGDHFKMTVERDGKTVEIDGLLLHRMDRHVFRVIEKPTEEQRYLRDRWGQNY